MDKIEKAERQIRESIRKAVADLAPVVKMKLPVRCRQSEGPFRSCMAESPNSFKTVQGAVKGLSVALKAVAKHL